MTSIGRLAYVLWPAPPPLALWMGWWIWLMVLLSGVSDHRCEERRRDPLPAEIGLHEHADRLRPSLTS